jgi:hypothetical protein
VPAELNVCAVDGPPLMVEVEKLPPLPVALCGAWPVFFQVTVSPVSIVTVPGEKKKSPIVTVAEEAAWALPLARVTVVGSSGNVGAELDGWEVSA